MPRLVSVGEVVVELFGDIENGYRLSFVGAARDMAFELRSRLGADWSVDLFTVLGDDVYSQNIVDDLAAKGVGIRHVFKVPGRNVGLSVVGESGDNGPIVTDWRSHAAARLLADDVEAMSAAFAQADVIYVTGGAFAILVPRARGRLLKALYRAREAGSRIVLNPLEWRDQWSSDRVLGSALNSIATVADVVFTARPGEGAVFGDASAESISRRYHEWGVGEVLVRSHSDGVYVSISGAGRWIAATAGGDDALNSAYLAARLGGAAVDDAGSRPSRSEPPR